MSPARGARRPIRRGESVNRSVKPGACFAERFSGNRIFEAGRVRGARLERTFWGTSNMAVTGSGAQQGDKRNTLVQNQRTSTSHPDTASGNGSANVGNQNAGSGDQKNKAAAQRSKPARSAESTLDTLFASQETYEVQTADTAPQFSPMDALRRRFVTELVPAFAGLAEKYAAKGVILELDADHFVNGGRNLTITIQFENAGTRLDGVVTDAAIAFTETRFSATDRGGVAASGPSLRTRDLSAHLFRDFICRQIAPLVQSALRRRR